MSQLRNAIIANLGGSGPEPLPVADGKFKFTVDTTLTGNNNYFYVDNTNYTTDWGDGTVNSGQSGHTYSTPGTYQITITFNVIDGAFGAFGLKNTRIVSLDSAIPKCSNTYGLDSLCQGDVNLESVYKHLFYFNSHATELTYLFQGCTKLKTVPAELFQPLSSVTYFDRVFESSGLETIPAGLFDNMTNMTRATYLFNDCTNLTSVPEYLFRYTTKLKNFNYVFSGCTKLQLNKNIFCDEATESTTRFATGSSYFNHTFYVDSYSGVLGEAPSLWNYTFNSVSNYDLCFGGSGNSNNRLINYYSVPVAWGGTSHPFTVLDHCYFNSSPVSLGFKFTSDVTQLKISFTAQNSNWILGARDYQTSSERFTIQAGTSTAIATNNISATTTTNIGNLSSRIDYTYDDSVITIVNNNNTYTSNNTRGFPNGTRVIMLGSIRNGSTIQTANTLVGYFWGLRTYESNTITHNIIPIKDGSNVVCLYDTIVGGEYKYPTSGTLLEDAPAQLNMINPGSLQMNLNNGDELDVEPNNEEEM